MLLPQLFNLYWNGVGKQEREGIAHWAPRSESGGSDSESGGSDDSEWNSDVLEWDDSEDDIPQSEVVP